MPARQLQHCCTRKRGSWGYQERHLASTSSRTTDSTARDTKEQQRTTEVTHLILTADQNRSSRQQPSKVVNLHAEPCLRSTQPQRRTPHSFATGYVSTAARNERARPDSPDAHRPIHSREDRCHTLWWYAAPQLRRQTTRNCSQQSMVYALTRERRKAKASTEQATARARPRGRGRMIDAAGSPQAHMQTAHSGRKSIQRA